MGYENDENRKSPRNVVFSARPTVDKGSEDVCVMCGMRVRFTTNGSGGHMAVDPDSLKPHPCSES